MFPPGFLQNLNDLKLDIIGIVAVLGEGSTARNAQASALSWHHVMPRLLPAPQALLKHEQDKRLPKQEGAVIGIYSGNYKDHLNFFCQLLHPEDIGDCEVQYIKVSHKRTRKKVKGKKRQEASRQSSQSSGHSVVKTNQRGVEDDEEDVKRHDGQAFGIKQTGYLAVLSGLGSFMTIVLAAVSIFRHDGFALIATIALSVTSTLVGLASWWSLDFKEVQPREGRDKDIPDSDLVIYYPRQGSFRVVTCKEPVSRLYFKTEKCNNTFSDGAYRSLAVLASIFLMIGLLCMGNSKIGNQIAFAGAYVVLNLLYWGVSALNPQRHHWTHPYQAKVVKFRTRTPGHAILKSPTKQLSGDVGKAKKDTPNPSADSGNAGAQAASRTSAITWSGSGGMEKERGNLTRRRTTFNIAMPAEIAKTADDEDGDLQRQYSRHDTVNLERQPDEPAEGGSPPGRRQIRAIARSASNLFRFRTNSRLAEDEQAIPLDPTFTAALWQVIALTGNIRWLDRTHIAPDNDVWKKWIKEAGRRAAPVEHEGKLKPAWTQDEKGIINLPEWDYQGRLTELFKAEAESKKRRPPTPPLFRIVQEAMNTSEKFDTRIFGPTARRKILQWMVDAKEARRKAKGGFIDDSVAIRDGSPVQLRTSRAPAVTVQRALDGLGISSHDSRTSHPALISDGN